MSTTVDWAIFCDYAFQDAARKICLIGVFDRIFAQAVPAQHHQSALVIRFRGEPESFVDFKIEVMRPMEKGGQMGSSGGKTKLGDTGTVEVIVNFVGLPLPDYGTYCFNVKVGEELLQVAMFSVLPPPEAPKRA